MMNGLQNALLIFAEELIEVSEALIANDIREITAEWNDLIGSVRHLEEYGVLLPIDRPSNNSLAYRDNPPAIISLLKLHNEVSKAIRFGIDEIRDLPTTNRQRILASWNAVYRELSPMLEFDMAAQNKKVKKIKKFTAYSIELNQVII